MREVGASDEREHFGLEMKRESSAYATAKYPFRVSIWKFAVSGVTSCFIWSVHSICRIRPLRSDEITLNKLLKAIYWPDQKGSHIIDFKPMDHPTHPKTR